MQNKQSAFSLVEIIIAISIIALLAVIGISYNQGYKDKSNNTKIVSDVETINNALESYAEENNSLPMPGGNTNFFKIDTSYSHSYEDTETFGVYGSFTEDTVPKKYLYSLPLDPKTNSYYSYGKTGKNIDRLVKNQFEIASVQNIDGAYKALVRGSYTAEAGPYNLIREYNGSNFVYDKSKTNLPYNPEELILIATVDGVVYRENDTITTIAGETKEIYFSDGSVSVLEPNSSITLNKLNFPSEDNLSTIVKLSLGAGTIWTKATHLDNDSEFEIYTTDTTAAVRGTIFGVSKDASTEVLVIEGEVEVYKNDEVQTKIIDLVKDESVRVLEGQREGTATLQKSDFEGIENNFEVKEDIRGAETVAMINQEIAERENENIDIPEDNSDETPSEEGPTCSSIYNFDGYQGTKYLQEDESEELSKTTPITGGQRVDTIKTICIKLGYGLQFNTDNVSTTITCGDGYTLNGDGDSCEVEDTPTLCNIGDLDGTEDENGICTAEEENITPGAEIDVNLSGAFDIEIEVDSVPDEKQYLLYGLSGEFRLFFGNGLVGNIGDICFQKFNNSVFCKPVGDDNKITISRDSSDEISLNGSDTDRNISGEIENFYLGRAVPNISSLRMNISNKIDLKVIK